MTAWWLAGGALIVIAVAITIFMRRRSGLAVPIVIDDASTDSPTGRRNPIQEAWNAVDDLERASFSGLRPFRASELRRVAEVAEGIQGPDGCRLRAACALLRGELIDRESKSWPDREYLKGVSEIRSLGPDDDIELRTSLEARIESTRLVREPSPEAMARAEATLARVTAVRAPATRLRLALLAADLAHGLEVSGDWAGHIDGLERAATIALDLHSELVRPADGESSSDRSEWCDASARVAGAAANLLGRELSSVGRREESKRWNHRAIDLLAGTRSPSGHFARADVLRREGEAELEDPLCDPATAIGLLEQAVAEGFATEASRGVEVACQISIRVGLLHWQAGRFEEASNAFRTVRKAAADRSTERVFVAYDAEALALDAGLARQRGLTAEAESQFRAAFHLGDDEDPEVRRLAFRAGCGLHGVLLLANRLDEARTLQETLRVRAFGLGQDDRRFAIAELAACEARLHERDGKPEAAAAGYAEAERVASELPDPLALYLAREMATELARLTTSREAHSDAELHYRRALDMPWPPEHRVEASVMRAELHLQLSRSLARQQRLDEAAEAAQNAFDLGRNAGDARGREVAARAALDLAHDLGRPSGQRHDMLVAAVELGRLSGTETAQKIVELAQRSLEEPDA